MSGIDISSFSWFLLRTRPNRVFKAAAALQERDLVTALPYEWRSRRRGSRHCKSVRRFPQAQLGPYLLTGFPTATPAWRELFDDPQLEPLLSGVVSITSDGMPSPIRPMEIFRQQSRYGTGLYQLPPKSKIEEVEDDRHFAVGDQVTVGTWRRFSRGQEEFDPGGFAGKVVTIDQIDGDMAMVILPMFQSEYRAEVPLEHLQAA